MASRAPVIISGTLAGIMTRNIVRIGPAPKEAAARSISGLTLTTPAIVLIVTMNTLV